MRHAASGSGLGAKEIVATAGAAVALIAGLLYVASTTAVSVQREPLSQEQACHQFADGVLGPPPQVSTYGTATSRLALLNANFDHKLAFTSLLGHCRADGLRRADQTRGYSGPELCALVAFATARMAAAGTSPAGQLERAALAESQARAGC